MVHVQYVRWLMGVTVGDADDVTVNGVEKDAGVVVDSEGDTVAENVAVAE